MAIITQAPKFYLFDVGTGHVARRRIATAAGADFGRAFEHFVLMELLAYRSYREVDFPVRFWRAKSGLDCDFVLGRTGSAAIEVEGSDNVEPRDFKGLAAFAEEHGPRLAIVVCNEPVPRRTATGIWMLPWREFLERLWGRKDRGVTRSSRQRASVCRVVKERGRGRSRAEAQVEGGAGGEVAERFHCAVGPADIHIADLRLVAKSEVYAGIAGRKIMFAGTRHAAALHHVDVEVAIAVEVPPRRRRQR